MPKQMLEQIAALRERKGTLIPKINAAEQLEGLHRQIAVRMLRGENAEDIAKDSGLSKYKVTMLTREVCAEVEPFVMPDGNLLGRVDDDIEATLAPKHINILRQAGIFTKRDLQALICSGDGWRALRKLHGCGDAGADAIMAAATELGLIAPVPATPEPELALIPEPQIVEIDLASTPDFSALWVPPRLQPMFSPELIEARRRLAQRSVAAMRPGPNGTMVDINGRVICTFNLRDLDVTEAFTLGYLMMAAAEAVMLAMPEVGP